MAVGSRRSGGDGPWGLSNLPIPPPLRPFTEDGRYDLNILEILNMVQHFTDSARHVYHCLSTVCMTHVPFSRIYSMLIKTAACFSCSYLCFTGSRDHEVGHIAESRECSGVVFSFGPKFPLLCWKGDWRGGWRSEKTDCWVNKNNNHNRQPQQQTTNSYCILLAIPIPAFLRPFPVPKFQNSHLHILYIWGFPKIMVP